MALMWIKEAIFNLEDIKWFMILGGYLSKEKRIINATQFNVKKCGIGYVFLVD